MAECKHGLETSWCTFCKGESVLHTRKPDAVLCVSPRCDRLADIQAASLPLCNGHFLHLESYLAKVNLPLDFEKLYPRWEKEWARQFITDFVYFARLGDAIKIGHSKQVLARLRTFAAYGQPCEPLGFEQGGRDLEGRLHRKFSEYRANLGFSRELFYEVPEILEYIESGRKCAKCSERALPKRITCERHHSEDYETLEALIGVQLHISTSETPVAVGDS